MFKWFGNKKISFQLLAGFAIVALLTAILGILGIAAINNLVTTNNQMYSQATVTVMKTGEITEAFHLIAVNVRDMVTADDIASIDARASDIKTLEATIDTLTGELDPLITDPTTRASYLEYTAARASYAKTLTSAINLAKTNADQTAILLIQGSLKEAADKELAALQVLAEKIKANAAQSAANSQATGQASGIFMIIVIAIVFILSILIGIGISRMLSVPLKKSLTMIEALSMGHLDNRIRFDSKSEIGQMSRAMDGLADYLQNTVIKSMQRIAAGDIDISLKATDSEDEITPAIQTTVDSISLILAKTQGMLQSVADGNMRTRIETQEFQGEWLKLATGINQIVDEISAPISEASMVMSMMADGNLTIRMTGQYKGDHEDFVKTPLNKSLDNISSYVNEIAEILTAMSGSNLQQEIVNEYPGDFAPIKDALNLIIDTFNKVLSDMNVAADQVTAGARQVADGSQSLSQGSTTQAASIEQLTASLTDIASQTRQNAVNATQASELAITTRSNAIAGNDRMKEMQKAMEEIKIGRAHV